MASYGGLDIQLLGIGSDGHIAFNEPGSSLSSRTRVEKLLEQTVKVLCGAGACVVCMVCLCCVYGVLVRVLAVHWLRDLVTFVAYARGDAPRADCGGIVSGARVFMCICAFICACVRVCVRMRGSFILHTVIEPYF